MESRDTAQHQLFQIGMKRPWSLLEASLMVSEIPRLSRVVSLTSNLTLGVLVICCLMLVEETECASRLPLPWPGGSEPRRLAGSVPPGF